MAATAHITTIYEEGGELKIVFSLRRGTAEVSGVTGRWNRATFAWNSRDAESLMPYLSDDSRERLLAFMQEDYAAMVERNGPWRLVDSDVESWMRLEFVIGNNVVLHTLFWYPLARNWNSRPLADSLLPVLSEEDRAFILTAQIEASS